MLRYYRYIDWIQQGWRDRNKHFLVEEEEWEELQKRCYSTTSYFFTYL